MCERRADPALAAIAWLAHDRLDPIDAVMPIATLAGDLPAALGLAGYPAVPGDALAADIIRLAMLHAAIRSVERVRIRLEWIVTDACKRFHADYVTTRLLVTYRGAGTQWILADRPAVVGHIPCGAVAILKGGCSSPNPACSTARHPSPPRARHGCCW
ncbi:MAG: DUF1826 domain-containing protein [Sphingomonas taxi]